MSSVMRLFHVVVLFIALAFQVTLPGLVVAGGGPQNVAVVVNQDSWASLAIANHYVNARGIPPRNVIYLKDIESYEQIDVDQFRMKVLIPVLETLKTRGIDGQIDVITYSADFPYAVQVRSDLKNMDAKKVPRVLTPVGSLTGMTFLHQRVMAAPEKPESLPLYLQLNANGYYRRFGTPLPDVAPESLQLMQQGLDKIRKGEEKAAEKLLRDALAKSPNHPLLQYNLACALARQGKADSAIEELKKSVKNGWYRKDLLQTDKDLESLRKREDFQGLVTKVDVNFKSEPSVAFDSRVKWNARRTPAPTSKAGADETYYLSTMLGMTSGRGNSVDEVLMSIGRSVAADGNPPKGVIYFPTNNNVRSRTRERLFPAVVAQLEARGIRADSSTGVIPQNKDDVAGAMVGAASFDWAKSKCRILPGAICEHLTSFGGVLREAAGQTPLTEFIRHGAAGASGTVTEPYAIAAKFPTAFLHVHYTAGCNLAESFYQSVAGPYQLLIVGDPLCQPWAVPPNLDVDSPVFAQGVAMVRDNFQVRVKLSDSLASFACLVDGRKVDEAKPGVAIKIPVIQLADGPHQLTVVGISASPIQTQIAKSVTFDVRRHSHQVQLKLMPNSQEQLAYSGKLSITVNAEGAQEIVVYRDHQVLKKIEGGSSTFTVSANQLGVGVSRIWARATFADGQQSVTEIARCRVTWPKPLMPANAPDDLKDGLKIFWSDGDSSVVQTTRPSDWLAELHRPKGSTFQTTAFLNVETEPNNGSDDGLLHQLQLKTNGKCSIEINGEPVLEAIDNQWRSVPVVLKPGRHRFVIRGEIAANPRLSIRFGRRGASSLDNRFQYSESERP